ncbi:hypothetical protein DL897_03650 [Thermoflavimicrobium daqui]|uniref:Uncharacterized protein n=2 Tax=Thermoflavimicrobium daqui TaxID=2137476 RepID=A0A364K723_9BACL|nr:hypothetical protein DL897_03650 [Thermoflavimicrobium daqui]
MITSNYYNNGKKNSPKTAMIAIIDLSSKKLVNTIQLIELGGPGAIKHRGHVGGITIAGDYLWISSTIGDLKYLYSLSLSKVEQAKNGDLVKMDRKYGVRAASAITYKNGELWLVEYKKGSCKKDYSHKNSSAKLYRYKVNTDGSIKKVGDFKIPDRVQVMMITDTEFFFSRSCGRTNPSDLTIYKNQNGKLGKFVKSVKMPPMSEGIVQVVPTILLRVKYELQFYEIINIQ